MTAVPSPPSPSSAPPPPALAAGAGAGLYLHIPFCRGKCPYCDFFSRPAAPAEVRVYLPLLERQLELAAAAGALAGPLTSIFFGGGTPSLLPPAGVARLIERAVRLGGSTPELEITLEANPGTLSLKRLSDYRRAGVNRLSLGVQSFQPELLRRLGRRHTARQAWQACEQAQAAGFTRVGIDLMFAIPGQTPALLARDLALACGLGLEHLSLYGLTAERGTPLARQVASGRLLLPDEGAFARQFGQVHGALAAAGYRHYEISNYARPGAECRHNLLYWRRQPCLGIGAGAHSFRAQGWGERRAVAADLARFAAALDRGRDPARLRERFDRQGAMLETVYLGLRCADGIAEAEFRARFGRGLAEAFPAAVGRCRPWLRQQAGRWMLNVAGWLIYNHLIGHFFAEKESARDLDKGGGRC